MNPDAASQQNRDTTLLLGEDVDVPGVSARPLEEDLADRVRDKVGATLSAVEGGQQEKEKTALKQKVLKTISNFVPHQTDDGMKNMLAEKITSQLGDLNFGQSMEMANNLEEYLRQMVFEAEKLIKIDTATAERLEREIKADGKDAVLKRIELEKKELKEAIEDRDEQIAAEERTLKDYAINKGNGATNVLGRRKEIEDKIQSLRKKRQGAKDKARSLEREIVAVGQIAGNIDKAKGKVSPETLLAHIHYYFEEIRLFESLGDMDDSQKMQESMKQKETMYRQAIGLADKDMKKYQLENSGRKNGFEVAGISSINLKTLIEFVAESDFLDNFPDKKKEKAAEALMGLKSVNPDTEQGAKKLERFINQVGALLPPETMEKDLQRITARLIATMEVSMDGEKWRTGVNGRNIRKIVKLTSGIRRAYENRLKEKETGGDYRDLMAKVEAFNRSINEAKQNVSPDLPRELRKHFSENFWLYRGARFVGAKGWSELKKGTPTFAKAGRWSAKKSLEAVKKHPWGATRLGIAGLSIATGYLPAALTAYALWRGGKRILNLKGGKNKMPKIPDLPKKQEPLN